jgi:hypothetical protein
MPPNAAYEIKKCTTMSGKLAWQGGIYYSYLLHLPSSPTHHKKKAIYISMSKFLI